MADAAASRGRDPGEVTLVAAAKRVPAEAVSWIAEAGVSAVGENYVQELRDKRGALGGLPVRWHFIGTLQTGTAHWVADLADVVETVSGERGGGPPGRGGPPPPPTPPPGGGGGRGPPAPARPSSC